ncbi:MAG: methionyl-tRNA formyltransferase [Planctomycetia bacterium]|nr:methionyl-tRNA formyltransferase [Planctomycetia bacterium]
MRLAVFGTGPFGMPSMEALYHSSHQIVALITQLPQQAPSRKALEIPEIARFAQEHDIPIFHFQNVKSPEAVTCLQNLNADLFFVCDFGQILSQEGIRAAKYGGINLHGSLLPKYRGAAPVHWAMLHGDAETGITVIHITPTVDAGPILSTEKTPIFYNETHPQLEERLAKIGAKHVLNAVERFAAGEEITGTAVSQDPALVSKAPKIKKSQAEILWNRSAEEIRNQIRAFDAWPHAFTFWQRDENKPPIRLILKAIPDILSTSDFHLLPEKKPEDLHLSPETLLPGTVLKADETLLIKTGTDILCFHGVQPSGKKMMSISEFIRGYGLKPGQKLG